MVAGNSSQKELPEQVLVIRRVFDAPRDLVFNAWTDCERLMRWWGPWLKTQPKDQESG